MSELTTERLDKLQDNLLQFQDHYSDPADKENYDIFVDALHVIDEFKIAKEKILAYEQAAKNKVALPEALMYAEIYGRAFICVDRNGSVHAVDPSQITITILNEPANAQPVIPEQRQMVPDERPADSSNGNDAEAWFDEGWNACRAEMLKAQPVSEPYKLPVIGWLRSDVNSDDRRDPNAPLFVLGSNDPSEVWKVKYIPLTGNSPVIPDGWKLVPIEPTPKMLVAAMGMFTAEELAEAWGDMIEAAPAQEQK